MDVMKKYMLLFLVFVFLQGLVIPISHAEATRSNVSTSLKVAVKRERVSVEADDADLATALKQIGEKYNPPFSVESFATRRVTAHFENLSLEDAIVKLARENYALVIDKRSGRLEKVFLLKSAQGTSTLLTDKEKQVIKMFHKPVGDVQDYIVEKHKCLEDIVRDTPKKTLTAQISFNEFIPARKVLFEVLSPEKSKIAINTLNYGWGKDGGGFGVNNPNLSLEEGLSQALEFYRDGVVSRLNDAKSSIENPIYQSNMEFLKNTRNSIKEGSELLQLLEKGIIPVFGAEIEGTATRLKALTKNPHVRLVDSSECNKNFKEAFEEEGYEVRSIYTPLEPEKKQTVESLLGTNNK